MSNQYGSGTAAGRCTNKWDNLALRDREHSFTCVSVTVGRGIEIDIPSESVIR
ncbi:MAG TPA: hypothetical protein PKD24_16140 [Pyrinomonadaceae bacterium]|nr:hypothetical protein [Pyrinomonadaceae bacterium]HMP66917.1 hypothetical protein [Pyrinomonadaceae bacterium]